MATPEKAQEDVRDSPAQGPCDEGGQDQKKQTKRKRRGGLQLPEWMTSNLHNRRSLQLWLRCWVAAWAGFILMLPTRSLTSLGQAAFFCAMVLLMLPPLMTPFLWLLAMSTLVVGALLGWAIGCAAMASALRARNVVLTGAAIQRARQSAASATNPEAAFRLSVFEGAFLDTKSSVVFGVYLLVAAYVLGLVTAKAQKLKLFAIFATIVLDVYACYGPLFPSANYTLASIFMLPIAYALAIAAASIVLIFPRSLNADWTDELADLLDKTADLVDLHRNYLNKAVTGREKVDADGDEDGLLDQSSFSELASDFEPRFRALTAALINGVQSLTGSSPFLELEPSRGLFSGKDLRKVLGDVKAGGTRIFGLNAFHHLENDDPEKDAKSPTAADTRVQSSDSDKYEDENEDEAAAFHVHASLRLLHLRRRFRGSEAAENVRLREDLLPILHRGAVPALTAGHNAILALAAWVRQTNRGRWALGSARRRRAADECVKKLGALRDATDAFEVALDHFINKERVALLKPYEAHFHLQDDTSGSTDSRARLLTKESYKTFRESARPVFLCLVFCANLANFGHTYLTHARHIIALSERRVFGLSEEELRRYARRDGDGGDACGDGKLDYAALSSRFADKPGAGVKIWLPTGMRKIGKILLSRRGGASGVGPGSQGAFLSEGGEGEASEEAVTRRRRAPQSDPERGDAGSGSASVGTSEDGHRRAEMDELDDSDDEQEDEGQERGLKSSTPSQPSGTDKHTAAPSHTEDGATVADTVKKEQRQRQRRAQIYAPDPDALPPTNAFQRFSRLISTAYDAAGGDDGIFALRYAVVSVALWVPSVVPSSAGFAYKNRALWALIMAQTGLTTTTGEAVFQIAGRLGGTALGALLGMVAWYIASGSGKGNAIALGAVMGVVLVPLTFVRAFVPLVGLIPSMLTAVTLVLVVGYSWIDTHLPGLTVNSGWGKDVVWRRLLLVLIGVVAAIVVMLFPRPISTREQVRKGHASLTRDIHRLYNLLIEGYIASVSPSPSTAGDADEERTQHVQARIDAKLLLFRARFQIAQAKLAALAPKIKLAAIDLQLRGGWDAKRYDELLHIQARQLEALAQLGGSLHFMRPDWRAHFARHTAVLNPEVIADISTQLSLLATSLDTAQPLPHAGVGMLLERVLLAGMFSPRIGDALAADKNTNTAPKPNPDSNATGDGTNFLASKFSLETLQSPDYMNVVLGAVALTTLARRTDEMGAIVAGLCGEVSIRGFDRLRDDYGRSTLRACGMEAP